MTTQDRQPEAQGGEMPLTTAAATRPEQEAFAISPASAWLPPVYVRRSPGEASTRAARWRGIVTPAGWARREISQHGPARRPAPEQQTRRQDQALGGAMTEFPADLRYSNDHLWARSSDSGGPVRVGVTDFAQVSLGDVVDVTLPRPGETVTVGEPCGAIESTKSVSDLLSPVTGTVAARNDDLADNPDQVNTDPYGQGWMFEIDADPATLSQQLADLMDAAAYRQQVGE